MAGLIMAAPLEPIGARAGTREWTGLLVLALPTLLVSMDLSILFLAVPALGADLQPSSSQLLWITDIYGFLMAASLITMGTLGDKIGRRRLLLWGAAAFGAISVLAAFADSAPKLIAARALLGVASATLLPSTLALIRNMFHEPTERMRAIGLWTMTFSLGGVLGPLIGGAVIGHFGWGAAFLIAVPVMGVLLLGGKSLLPEFRNECHGPFDLVSAALSLAAILPLVYGIKLAANEGPGLMPLLAAGVGVAFGYFFVRRQLRSASPLLDLRLLLLPRFSAAIAANMAAIFAWMGGMFFAAQYLQLVHGLSSAAAGLWTVPAGFASALGCLFAPAISRGMKAHWATLLGLGSSACGLLLMTQTSKASGTGWIIAGTILLSVGAAIVLTLGTDLVMAAASQAQAGAASSLSETSTEIGGAFGIAVLGSIGNAIYRNEVALMPFAGLSGFDLQAARTTLSGALNAAGKSAADAAAVVPDAQAAFRQAMAGAAASGAAILVVACALYMFTLSAPRALGRSISRAGRILSLYGVVIVLLMIGGLKFTALEADALRPMISSTPVLSWMYSVMSVRGASNVLGVIEITTGILLAFAPWSARAGLAGGALASLTFLATASLMMTMPTWEANLGGFPALSPIGSFLVKDIVLLGAALAICGESLGRVASGSRPG